ncbi:MAG: branched-chain amino acid ABC transporter permease [Leucobacter sp.]
MELLTYLIAGLAVGASYALVGSGIVLVHRITGIVNFAQGTLAVLGGLLSGSLLRAGLPHGVGEIAAILLTGVFGLAVGAITLARKSITSLNALVVTLAISILGYAVIILIWGDGSFSAPGLKGSVTILGATVQLQYFIVIAAAAVTLGLLSLFFAKTYLGKAMTACAVNPFAARMVGINVRAMGMLAFFGAGLLGGIAGAILTPLREVSYSSDISFALYGFAAAVFGGLNSPIKTVIGGLILGVVSLLVAGYLDAAYQIVAALAIMLIVMIFQSGSHRLEEAK